VNRAAIKGSPDDLFKIVHRASFDRGLETHELGPLADDHGGVDRLADQWLQRRIGGGLLDRVELAVFQVPDPDPRRELEPEQAAEAEHVIGSAGRVRVIASRSLARSQ